MRVPPFNREPPSQPIDDPANPVLESQFMEIDQESQFESTENASAEAETRRFRREILVGIRIEMGFGWAEQK